MRPVTGALGAIGALLLFFEGRYLLTSSRDGDVGYQWAQVGAWLGAMLVVSAALKFVLWDRRRRSRR